MPCVGREIGKKYSASSEVAGYWPAFCFQFPSAFQEVALSHYPHEAIPPHPQLCLPVACLMSYWANAVLEMLSREGLCVFRPLCRAPQVGIWEQRVGREHVHGPTFPRLPSRRY